MPQTCLSYNALEDKACRFTAPWQVDLDLISPKAPVCWAVLDALNNNSILGVAMV